MLCVGGFFYTMCLYKYIVVVFEQIYKFFTNYMTLSGKTFMSYFANIKTNKC